MYNNNNNNNKYKNENTHCIFLHCVPITEISRGASRSLGGQHFNLLFGPSCIVIKVDLLRWFHHGLGWASCKNVKKLSTISLSSYSTIGMRDGMKTYRTYRYISDSRELSVHFCVSYSRCF